MKKLNQTIAFAILLLISIAVSAFLFFQVRDLKSELNTALKNKEKEPPKHYNNAWLDGYLAVDTLLAQERYQEAQLAYRKLLDKFPQDKALTRSIQLRIRDFRKLDKIQKKLSRYDDQGSFQKFASKIKQGDSLAYQLTRNKQTLENQLDSLSFALAKANALTASLQHQLTTKLSSSYLSFTDKKGVQVYYVGNIKNNQANGQGVGLYKNGLRYKGHWKNNRHQGQGTLYWPDGEYYSGHFQQDKRQGQGSYHWPNGDKFIGEWQNDKRNGVGTFYKKSGKVVARGIWRNNKFIRKKD